MTTTSFLLFLTAFCSGFLAFPFAVALFTRLCAMFNAMMNGDDGNDHEPRE